MTLADLFNAPTEFTLDGETFRVSKPGLLQQGEFQKWLEQLAFDAINSRTYQSDAEKALSIRMHDQDCAAGVYEWGSELSLRRIQTQKGLAKLLEIICREQGMTPAKSLRLVEEQALGLIQVFKDKVTADPKVLEATLSNLESPSAFLLKLLLTHPLVMPAPSRQSADSPTTS